MRPHGPEGLFCGWCGSYRFCGPRCPVVKKVDYDFSKSGHTLCIVHTGSCHADLTGDYADITIEMGAVAAYFGKQYLRDVPEDAFYTSLQYLRTQCGDRAVLRALHYFTEDRRAIQEAQALESGDFAEFLTLVNASGISSALYLQNIWSVSEPQQQVVSLALAVGRELLEGSGAIRVHGGGFAGTIQAFVPNEKLETFRSGMEKCWGLGNAIFSIFVRKAVALSFFDGILEFLQFLFAEKIRVGILSGAHPNLLN